MLQKNIVQLPKSQIDIQIIVPWADLSPKYNEIVSRLSAEVELPGFRKGQAPLEMVEPRISQQIQQELFKTVMPQFLIEALQGTQITPIDYPQYQIVAFAKGSDFKFSAKVTNRPEIKVGEYKAIKVSRPALKQISDEDGQKVVDDLYNRWKLRNPNPQPVTPAQPQGSSGSMSFNQSVQPVTPVAPASSGPDDVFAKAVGANDLNDLKMKIRQDLEDEAKYNNELDFEEAILQQIEKITTVDVPDILVQDELNRMLVSLQRSVTERGLLLDEYLKSQNKTTESIKNEWKPQAEKNVRMELGLSEVARQEGVTISDEELQAEINKIQDARVKAQFNEEAPRMQLRHALRQTKTLNLLKTLIG